MIKRLHWRAHMALKQFLVIKWQLSAWCKPRFIFRSRNIFFLCIPCVVLAVLTMNIRKRNYKKEKEITGCCVKGIRKKSYGAFLSRIFNSNGKNIRRVHSSINFKAINNVLDAEMVLKTQLFIYIYIDIRGKSNY